MTSHFREGFVRPIFIVSTPRSGSTLLFETLAQAPDLFTVGDESHGLIEGIRQLSPAVRGWASNVLGSEDATAEIAEQIAANFHQHLRNREGRRPEQDAVRLLEKTPKNSLRVGFFDAIWPDAQFVYLYRGPRPSISSMIEAWMSGRFRTYPQLPGWNGPPWSLLLVPGWERLNGMPLPAIAAHQWAITTNVLLSALESLDPARVKVIDYDDFVADPQREIESLAHRLDLRWDKQLGRELPFSRYTVSKPREDKWRAIEKHIEAVLPIVAEADGRARNFVKVARDRTTRAYTQIAPSQPPK
jgi:hypothetical protein